MLKQTAIARLLPILSPVLPRITLPTTLTPPILAKTLAAFADEIAKSVV